MTINGFIHSKGVETKISPTFSKMEFVVRHEKFDEQSGTKYENFIPIEVSNNHISKLTDIKTGDKVHVKFNFRGNLWKKGTDEEKAFLSLQAWDVQKIQ